MAVYNCSGNTANTVDSTNGACVGAADDQNTCSCKDSGSCQASSGGNDLLILAAIVLLLIVLLR